MRKVSGERLEGRKMGEEYYNYILTKAIKSKINLFKNITTGTRSFNLKL